MKVESGIRGTAEPDHINGKNSSHRHSRNIRKKNKHRQNAHRQDLFQDWAEEREEYKYNLKNSLIKSSIRDQDHQNGRSLTEAKKKQKEIRSHDLHGDYNIFKLPSSTIVSQKVIKDDIRLPTLDKKKLVGEQSDLFNPQRRKVVRIPIERLKPLPTDEVKRRFMLKYQFEHVKG